MTGESSILWPNKYPHTRWGYLFGRGRRIRLFCGKAGPALTAHRAVFTTGPFESSILGHEKTSIQDGGFFMAGAEGFEPSTKVLETHVLPLHHAPISNV